MSLQWLPQTLRNPFFFPIRMKESHTCTVLFSFCFIFLLILCPLTKLHPSILFTVSLGLEGHITGVLSAGSGDVLGLAVHPGETPWPLRPALLVVWGHSLGESCSESEIRGRSSAPCSARVSFVTLNPVPLSSVHCSLQCTTTQCNKAHYTSV